MLEEGLGVVSMMYLENLLHTLEELVSKVIAHAFVIQIVKIFS